MKATKKNPKLNVRLLRRIKKHILANPSRFFMGWYVARGVPRSRHFDLPNSLRFSVLDLPSTVPECGTAACIAGWANLFTGHKPTAHRSAAKALGLPNDNGLFSIYEWPCKYRDKYRSAKTSRARARIAANRIEHLIKTGE